MAEISVLICDWGLRLGPDIVALVEGYHHVAVVLDAKSAVRVGET